jgi:uncharacterized phage protein (TIGR02218 family)
LAHRPSVTWTDDEESQAGGAPIEGYEFVGSATTWRYTSHIEAVTINGDAYTPLAALIRDNIILGGTHDSRPVKVTLPASTQLVQHYGLATPPTSLQLNIYRYQPTSNDFQIVWTGEVTGIRPKGLMATLECPSILGARLGTTVSSLTVRRFCNHRLYDARCRVLEADFDFATTVSAVSGLSITLSGIGGHPVQWFRAGKITRDADGESRAIINQTSLPAVVTVHAPFRTLAPGDAVTLLAGCQHDTNICDTKFSNLANFGGFPTLLAFNPFDQPIKLGGQ